MTQEQFLLLVARRFQDAAVPFMVVGSHSSFYHSQPRTTHDADFVIDPTAEQLARFLASLGDDFYFSAESASESLGRRSMFNIVHLDSGWKADLIVRKDRPFSAEEFRRRESGSLYGHTLPIATAEDVILTKLEWDCITPSERQVRDALNVAAVKWPTLDLAYLRRWGGTGRE
jgi:hypothetical protein